MEINTPDVYTVILDADRESRQIFSGHGSALAQAYNHMIMPLANRRDKFTQILWGIRDFEHRFGRKPEGMWLPETAVDLETLDILAELGIKFTILAPHQASRVRRTGTDAWSDVSGGKIDPTMAYRLNLSSGRNIAVFFYDGPLSRSVAFEDLLNSGDNFTHRLTGTFSEERTWPQLVHIATDGETYGHHHRFGDMALAFTLHHIETDGLAKITNYGEYLEKHPPAYEVEISENTSWSCSHGIERWRSNCGCNAGRSRNWNQSWRAPLRQALDWLRDTLAARYEIKAHEFLKSPWAARDNYIAVVLDRSPDNVRRFLEQHRTRELKETEIVTVLKLLELQRYVMLMYTSCGWYFDELSGIETVQIIQYAGRAVQLGQELFGDDIDKNFLERLELARSNIQQYGDGRRIYDKFVKTASVDLTRVAAHFAISSLFREYEKEIEIYCYRISIEDYQVSECGKARLAAGRVKVTSAITLESALLSFGVLHFGGHKLNAGIREYRGEEEYQTMVREIIQTCAAADFPEVIRLLDKHLGAPTYSIKNLFLDEQRKVLNNILELALSEIEAAYYQLYERYYPPLRFLSELGNPVPRNFHSAAEFILNGSLRRALSSDTLDRQRIRGLLEEIQIWKVELDTEGLSYLLQQALERIMIRFAGNPEDIALLNELLSAAEMSRSVPFPIDLWKVQNLYHKISKSTYQKSQNRAQLGDQAAVEWLESFVSLGKQFSMRVG